MTVQILWRDGFDHYNNNTDIATLYPSTSITSIVPGREDGFAWRFDSYSASFYFQGISAQTDITFAFAINPQPSATIQPITLYNISNGSICTLNLGSPNQAIITFNGTSHTFSVPLIPSGNWTQIQFRVVIGTSGSFTLVFNGTNTVAQMSGINTTGNSGVATSCNGINFVPGDVPNQGETYFDDFVVATGGLIGDCRIQSDFAILDHAVAMTPLSGSSNYAMVDETAMDSDTTYVSTSTVGAQDLYGFTPIVLPAGSAVLEVSLVSAIRKTDAGTRQFTHKVLQGSTTASGTASIGISTSYQYQVDSFGALDPTGAPWTQTTINTAYYGGACSA